MLLLAAAVTAAMWRASAAARHLVWCVAVAGVLALPGSNTADLFRAPGRNVLLIKASCWLDF